MIDCPAPVIDTPIGPLTLVATADGAARGAVPERPTDRRATMARTTPDHPVLAVAAGSSSEYFAGDADRRSTCRSTRRARRSSAPRGRGWRRSRSATTISYGEQARRLGHDGKARAIGAANGSNPIPVILPCHRVIGSDGSLTGFGGGLETKAWLLHHERVVAGLELPL